MSPIRIIFVLTTLGLAVFTGLFVLASIREKKLRAVLIGLGLLLPLGLVVFAAARWPLSDILLGIVLLLLAKSLLLFFLPIGKTTSLKIGTVSERVDERDTAFAREEYLPGSEKYTAYYARHPEKQAVDDRFRKLPGLLAPGGKYYDKVRSEQVQANFAAIKELTTTVDGAVEPDAVTLDPAAATADIKRLVRSLGADDVGIARLNPMFVYSHVGRGPEPWGAPIENTHRYAVAFTLEMDIDCVEQAPALAITEEAAHQYLRAAEISVALARYIRGLGYSARAHISDSNYQIMLPAVAHDAGLGELGRMGYLISPKYGPRIRLGGVTTDLPLIPNGPIRFGVQEFCDICRKCADNCPSAAIPSGGKVNVRGVEKWLMDVEQCIYYWRAIGTDCGLCMRVCPYSHPPTLVHNIVRTGIKRSTVARHLAIRADDLLYGRKVTHG